MEKKIGWKQASYMYEWLDFQSKQSDIPGFVVAVAKDGDIKFNEAFGYADLEKKQKLSVDNIFRIASHSKTFTATAILQLQEAGKLKIDDKVVDFLPWLKHHTDKRYSQINIRQLMSHSAGVVRDGQEQGYWSLERPFPDRTTFKQDILNTKLVIDNNIKLKYSNYGFTLLGMVVEAASGMSYNQYVTKNIVDVLELSNTGPELDQKSKAKLATGYSRPNFNKKRLPIDHIDTQSMSSATGFYSTTEDLCTYFSAQMIGSGKLLSDESKKEMQRTQWSAQNTEHKTDYGLGLDIEYSNDRRLLGHGGGFPGFITKSLFDNDDKLVVIVLTNAMGAWASGIAHSIVKSIDYLSKETGKPDKKLDLSRYEGRYMGLWNMMDFVSLKDKMIAAWSEGWDPFENPDELEYVGDDTFKIIKTSSFGSGDELVKFNFTKSGLVDSVLYAGELLLPEKTYADKVARIKRIELP